MDAVKLLSECRAANVVAFRCTWPYPGPCYVTVKRKGFHMTKIIIAATLLALSAAPALAMGCCGSPAKGKPGMCAKGGMKGRMAMNHGTMKKGGCCCEGMAGNMSKRS